MFRVECFMTFFGARSASNPSKLMIVFVFFQTTPTLPIFPVAYVGLRGMLWYMFYVTWKQFSPKMYK